MLGEFLGGAEGGSLARPCAWPRSTSKPRTPAGSTPCTRGRTAPRAGGRVADAHAGPARAIRGHRRERASS